MLTMAGRRAAGPRGRSGHPEPGRRRGARAAATEHRGGRLAVATCWPAPGEPAGDAAEALIHARKLRRATELRLSPARWRKCWRSSLGPGQGARRGSGAHELRPRQRDAGALRSRRPGDAQHADASNSTVKTTEANNTVIGAEQPAERRCRHQSGAGSQEARQEETTNYEISKTVRTLIHEQPQIDRISLAVMVDDARHRGRRRQADLAAALGRGARPHHHAGEERDRL